MTPVSGTNQLKGISVTVVVLCNSKTTNENLILICPEQSKDVLWWRKVTIVCCHEITQILVLFYYSLFDVNSWCNLKFYGGSIYANLATYINNLCRWSEFSLSCQSEGHIFLSWMEDTESSKNLSLGFLEHLVLECVKSQERTATGNSFLMCKS